MIINNLHLKLKGLELIQAVLQWLHSLKELACLISPQIRDEMSLRLRGSRANRGHVSLR